MTVHTAFTAQAFADFWGDPDPAEALSDLVDVGEYRVEDEAFEYLEPGAEWSPGAIPALLEQDVPVYASMREGRG